MHKEMQSNTLSFTSRMKSFHSNVRSDTRTGIFHDWWSFVCLDADQWTELHHQQVGRDLGALRQTLQQGRVLEGPGGHTGGTFWKRKHRKELRKHDRLNVTLHSTLVQFLQTSSQTLKTPLGLWSRLSRGLCRNCNIYEAWCRGAQGRSKLTELPPKLHRKYFVQMCE